jgi:hypothetical protein
MPKIRPRVFFQKYRQMTWLAYAIQWRLSLYVADKIRRNPTLLLEQKKGRPLLDYALRLTMVSPLRLSNQEEGPVYAVVELLLLYKANPNKGIYVYEGKTPWGLYLGACFSYTTHNKASTISSELGNGMTLLLNHGADPDVKVPTDS